MAAATSVSWVLVAVYGAAVVVAAVVGVAAWRRRHVAQAAIGLAMAMAGAGLWSLADLMMAATYLAPALAGLRALWVVGVFPGVGLVSAGFVLLSLAVRDRDWRPSPRVLLGLGAYPLILVVLAGTNAWTGALLRWWGTSAAGPWLAWRPGWWFWPHSTLCYLALGWSAWQLLRSLGHASGLHRRQVGLLLAAAAIPVAGSLLTIGYGQDRMPELTGICFVVTGAVDGWALFRAKVLKLVPIARGLLLDRMRDAVVVIDPDGRLLDVNQAGERLIRSTAPGTGRDLVGLRAEVVLRGICGDGLETGLHTVSVDHTPTVMDVSIEPVRDRSGDVMGRVLVARDVTDLHAQREQLASANTRLRDQLATIEGLRADLAEQAVRDELTGLHNRRYLVQALNREVSAAQQRDGHLSVVVLDIDHFKTVNDEHGHDVGDALLRAVAHSLLAGVRDADVVARYGGEEFVILLPGADRDVARLRVHDWGRRCRSVAVPGRSGPVSRTVSMGVASLADVRPDACTPLAGADLLRAADHALYRAKAAGRDRVEIAGEDLRGHAFDPA